MIQFLSRALAGDLIWFVLGGSGAVVGYLLAGVLRNRVARVLVGLLLAAGGVLLAHYAFEQFNAWYNAPLAPPLHYD